MNYQECKTRPQVINLSWDEPVVSPFSIETSKCSGSCNNINYQYANICVPDVAKNVNDKVFNLMSKTNETRLIEWHKHVNVSVNLEKMVVIINKVGIKINADVNVKN